MAQFFDFNHSNPDRGFVNLTTAEHSTELALCGRLSS